MVCRCRPCSGKPMPGSRLDRWLAPWVFVITGIVFNVLSAVITHYFIGLNNDDINIIDREVQNRQVLIDSLWQSKIEVERKKEFFILLLSNGSDQPATTQNYFRTYLNEVIDNYALTDFRARMDKTIANGLNLLLDLSNAAQELTIESINATYFEILELHETRMPLERSNFRLFSIAIFLQVIGLILVLARDLRRQ
jgi:hypothetical protein